MSNHLSLALIISLLLVSCNYNSVPKTNKLQAVEMINQAQELSITAIAEIGGEKIELEVAQTPQQQQIGLMFRDSVAPNRGMLFPFEPPRMVSFWMKNVVIPLDMIFISEGVIQHIETNVPPCQTTPCPVYGPNVMVDQVIELAGGRSTELKLNQGDRLDIKFLSEFQ